MLNNATAISDNGYIAGSGTDASGNVIQAFRLQLLPGDANLDGKVDINDLTKVLTNYNKHGHGLGRWRLQRRRQSGHQRPDHRADTLQPEPWIVRRRAWPPCRSRQASYCSASARSGFSATVGGGSQQLSVERAGCSAFCNQEGSIETASRLPATLVGGNRGMQHWRSIATIKRTMPFRRETFVREESQTQCGTGGPCWPKRARLCRHWPSAAARRQLSLAILPCMDGARPLDGWYFPSTLKGVSV